MIYENLGSQKLVNSARRSTKIPRLGLLHMRYKAVRVPQQPAEKNICHESRGMKWKESLTKKTDKRS
ncbi:hypothetical protein DPMN_093470 [Dreissena polymorpha]|uniref:Uncharacterized protein n=1 Tax=Dreissena polymorpha TaxID=45954 RepID=A0A9D4R1R6_DREPO|nr:hypothetical protein DPMN_093470 [Dreissena polymorpha]